MTTEGAAANSPTPPPAISDKVTYNVRTAPSPDFPLRVAFELLPRAKGRCYAVQYTSDVALEGAWIAATVPLQFLSSRSASYEMTVTDADTERKLGNKFSATLRLKPNCKSAEFSFRPVDGYAGQMEIFVSAVNSTGRITQRECIPIAPLSSYRRIDAVDESRWVKSINPSIGQTNNINSINQSINRSIRLRAIRWLS